MCIRPLISIKLLFKKQIVSFFLRGNLDKVNYNTVIVGH